MLLLEMGHERVNQENGTHDCCQGNIYFTPIYIQSLKYHHIVL